VLDTGKNEQRQDDASKEVTALEGVAVVRITMGFHPDPAIDRNAWDTLQGVSFRLTADEKRARDVVAVQAS
jgi:hypothetical protein